MKPLKRYAAWRKYRETRIALGHLSERELADIGVARTDIRAVARRAL